jgi:hypothetical protein
MIWEARSQQEREMLAHEVEARLLSGDTWAHTAARAGVDVPTIQAYEALFFNVADRLDQESYIYHQVMGRSLQEGVRERQYDLLWKMYGYRGGPIVLDMLVATTPTMPRCDTLDELKVWMEQQTQLQSTQKAMIAARTLDASNGFNQVEVIRTYAQLREMEANVDNKGKGATTALTANVEAMCRALPFSVGRQRPGLERSLTADSVHAYDGYEAELRGDEVMALSLGEEPPQLEQVKMLKFPPLPPPSKTPAPETA